MPEVTVQVVGAGDAFGNGGRFQACVSVRAPEGHALLDCGATSLVAMKRLGLDPGTVDVVLVTHLHGDHFGGLPFLILDGQFRRRTEDLTVVGPPGTAERLTAAMEALFPGSSTVQRRFQVRVREHLERAPAELGDTLVTAFEVRHASGAPAYAVRVSRGGATVTYSGDTEWTDVLLDAARGAQLCLLEGYSPSPVRWHLDLDSLTRHRDRFDCDRLVLTHLSPTALAMDLSDWEVADDGLRLTV